jgi:hypothetical protein
MSADFKQIKVERNWLFVLQSRVPYIGDVEAFQTEDIILTSLLPQTVFDVFVRSLSTHPVSISRSLASLLPSKLAADGNALIRNFKHVGLS